MRAHRTLALLVAAGALAAGVGTAVLVPGVAAAAPGYTVQPPGPYPAPPPAVTVNTATVTTGKTVRVSGIGFAKKEPVAITIKYRITPRSAAFTPPYGGGGMDKADGQGKVRAKVSLKFPGYATITVKGLRSHKSASVTVRVLAWRGAWGGLFRETGFSTDGALEAADTVSEAVAVDAQQQVRLASGTTDGHQPDAELLAGMLGAVGLLGTGVVALRRRRA
jgi:hypothetical protein